MPTVNYTRGTDLSGTFEGAGGIGGLLTRSDQYNSGTGVWSRHVFYHADGNGNVTYTVDTSQAKAGEWRYDPYGRSLYSSTPVPNLMRFSSKLYHSNSGLYYYGYRFYDPNLQRWLNRDPIGELGGVNLYTFVRNAATDLVDLRGLKAAAQNGDTIDQVADWVLRGTCAFVIGMLEKRSPDNLSNSRYAHCMVSCKIAKACGQDAAAAAGVGKEVYDLAQCFLDRIRYGKWNSPHCRSAFQPTDLKDDLRGILGKKRPCDDNEDCADCCRDLWKAEEPPPGPFYRK